VEVIKFETNEVPMGISLGLVPFCLIGTNLSLKGVHMFRKLWSNSYQMLKLIFS